MQLLKLEGEPLGLLKPIIRFLIANLATYI
jgi:hypothetical protein